jgi:hypothetical protein
MTTGADVSNGVVRADQQRGTRLTGCHDHHHIAVEPCPWREVHAHRPVLPDGGGEPVRRTFCCCVRQRFSERERQGQRVLRVQAGQRHLLRLQRGLFGAAVPRGDRRWDRHAQSALLEAEKLCKSALQHEFVAGFEIADVRGVQAVGVRLEHHGCVAFFQRFLVLPLGFALGNDHAFLALAVELRCEAKQHRRGGAETCR